MLDLPALVRTFLTAALLVLAAPALVSTGLGTLADGFGKQHAPGVYGAAGTTVAFGAAMAGTAGVTATPVVATQASTAAVGAATAVAATARIYGGQIAQTASNMMTEIASGVPTPYSPALATAGAAGGTVARGFASSMDEVAGGTARAVGATAARGLARGAENLRRFGGLNEARAAARKFSGLGDDAVD